MAESIFSQMGAVIHTSLDSVKTELQNNIDTVQSNVDSSDTAIAGVATDLATEATRATTAETNLQTNITSEATTRSTADTTLQTNIDNEVSRAQLEETTLQNNIDLKFDKVGGEVSGSVIPATNITYDLGSPTKMWKDIYVGPGSLYVNGQKVLEENAGTITISADDDQNVQIKTGGGGDIEFYPSGTGNIDMKGNLSIQAGKSILSGDGQPITIQPGIVNAALKGDSSAENFIITGNLTVSGTTTTVDTETLLVSDNIVTLNANATGTPTENAGLTVNRGESADSKLIWAENDDTWKISNDGVVFKTIVGEGDITTTTLGLNNVDNTSDIDKPVSTATQTALNTKLNLTGGTVSGAISFGSQTRQMLNLYGAEYGIGVQGGTQYCRTGFGYAWYVGGVHSYLPYSPGTGGSEVLRLSGSEFKYKGNAVWTEGNDGSGSGLDADTVDGLNSSAFELKSQQTNTNINGGTLVSVNDGWYSWTSDLPTDAPFNYGQLIQSSDISQKVQLAFGGDGYGKLAVRRADGGNFYNWTTFWSDANDGSGSGLDADKLDGQEGSYYQPASTAVTDSDVVFKTVTTAGDFGPNSSLYSVNGKTVSGSGNLTLHGEYTDFNTEPSVWGWSYVQGTTNGPSHSGFQGGFRNRVGLGSDYSNYGMELLIGRSSQGCDKALYMRQLENNVWDSWDKIDAGNADTLDGLDSTDFLRSNSNTTFMGAKLNVRSDPGSTILNTSGAGHNGLEVFQNTSGDDATMAFHIGGQYAMHFGIDGGNNKLSVGGWSLGANSYAIYHEGNKPTPAEIGALATAGKAADSELLDGHDSGVFERWTGTYSATCAAGWVTIANFTDNRGHAEFYVWDLDSSDHSFIHIEATRSYYATSITVLNTGGYQRRITGARFLGDSDITYGNKKLQVYVTTSSLYYMRSKNSDKLIGFNSVSPCTPVLEGTPSGYSQVCITENFSHINGGMGSSGIGYFGSTVYESGGALAGRYLGLTAKAADSNLLDGYDSSQNSTASTVAVRNGEGDINARLFRSEYDSTNATINFIMTQVDTASNNYIRPSTPAQFRAAVTDSSYLGTTAKAVDSDLLDGYDWMQSGKNVRGTEIYCDSWFRSYQSGDGLYNETNLNHWYSESDKMWSAAGNGTAAGINLRGTYADTVYGALYADNNLNVGLLDSGGNWAIQHMNDSGTHFYTDDQTLEFSVGRDTIGGDYGTVSTHTTRNGWGGYSIANRVLFMHDHSNSWGIFNDVNNEWLINGTLNGGVELRYDGVGKLLTTSTGVDVTGTLTATSKSFVIDHPSQPDKKLQYACLEGPENGVYVRGKLTEGNTIELPDYWVDLVHEDSITVNLTGIGRGQQLYVESVDTNTVVVGNENENVSINCFYTVYAERKDIDKLNVEF